MKENMREGEKGREWRKKEKLKDRQNKGEGRWKGIGEERKTQKERMRKIKYIYI